MKLLSLTKTLADRETARFLSQRESEEIPDYPLPLTCEHFRLMMESATTSSAPITDLAYQALIASCLSFLFGQRVSDILLLRAQDITTEIGGLLFDNPSLSKVITVRRGKVIQFTGPYVLHLKGNSELSLLLQRLTNERQEPESLLFHPKTAKYVASTLKLYNEEYETRSVRRGGLQALALTGMPLADIRRHFSKHRDDAMLLRYLQHGAPLLEQRNLHFWSQQLLLGPDSI
jgi:integrase